MFNIHCISLPSDSAVFWGNRQQPCKVTWSMNSNFSLLNEDDSDCTDRKSVSLYYQTDLLLDGVTNTGVNRWWMYESRLSRKPCFSITIATNGPLVDWTKMFYGDVIHQRCRQVYIYAYTPARRLVCIIYTLGLLYLYPRNISFRLTTGPLVEIIIE